MDEGLSSFLGAEMNNSSLDFLEGEAGKEATNVKYQNLLLMWRNGAGDECRGWTILLGMGRV